MGRDGEMAGKSRALRQIVALLLALADLAECASGRSRPVRWLVLLILAPGEAVARDYLAGLTGVPAHSRLPLMPARPDDGVAEAMRLASVFRALAAALAALPNEAGAPAMPPIGALAAFRDLMATPPVELRDSS